ncbi:MULTISPECIES: DUF2560 family protein [Serratia]|uniref:DUF2560 family protein n=1 Tax=Serratia TaxID=613 RepID=UPI00066E5D50|nr:DUF2560 family protein [Serratia marcescens]OAH29131.1 hypothetical protein AYJ10_05785 [Serratia marcescens]CAI2031381.1 Protein of uncharacterised function (DUF2560) [Serratia marcescens]CAI2099727.1 Protein of uncharacterised function (DUF2560) [Serratia marcescens]
MAIIEMTELQAMNLEIFRMVQNDTAAAEKAITFISGDKLKYELFKDGYVRAQNEGAPVSRVDKAIRTAEEALDLFKNA